MVLSSRWFHPSDKGDSLSTIEVISRLKPDRIDWTYTADIKTIGVYKSLGIPFSLAINPQFPDSAGYTTAKLRIKEINGNAFVAPWMKSWKITNPYWGCVNNPLFVKLFKKRILELVDLGAYAVFIDDALFNLQLLANKPNEHGCFCQYCVQLFLDSETSDKRGNSALFRKNVLTNKQLIDRYEIFQKQSVIKFLKGIKSNLTAKKAKLLFNNPNGSWDSVYSIADGGIAELNINNLNISYLTDAFKRANSRGKSQIFSLSSQDTEAQEYLIAYCYMNKRDFLVPWDIYIKDQTRYYINLDHFKDFLDRLSNCTIMIKSKDYVPNSAFKLEKSNRWYSLYINGGQHLLLLNLYKNS